ncbi:rhomboid family intramembrane serine protease [Dokdonella sp.]|uniref:rhomboid family intramembrane serine protease n=1 Tax=Dokdonella sp. TaxID=2291710 RepID=UPI0025BFD799|nr:rhomboid family intramembrane serine protease [Dokdonella sp.]MBX3690169.1 rhomboid family intramembrane serine protease [Dokdonella sp.]
MEIAPPVPDPTARSVAQDRARIRYAMLGALALTAGLWLAWLAAWLLGWRLDDLGITPRQPAGLIGILTAPLAHASFAHLVSNTLPIALLTTLTLYNYPRGARLALPLIWLLSGLGVWLFARDSVHVGASGVANGLMLFLFIAGLLRRDRLAVVTALVVFFLYGGMLASVLPTEQHISFEYHLAGAIAGVISAIAFFRRDPLPPRKRYSWEDEPEDGGEGDELELPRPREVPVLWQRSAPPQGAQIIVFRQRQMPPHEHD